jgi:FkbM family methyltransferase
MEKKLRALMLQTLGTERYLSLVSQVYIRMIRAGMMKAKYPELFHLKQLIKPGFVCIDIGANIGYYSTLLSELCGKDGKVHAVEPVKLFQTIFTKNIRSFDCKNVTLHPVALGGSASTITMGTPMIDGVFRHGLTHVVEESEDVSKMHTYTVEMCEPDTLFANLERLDFIKCDVEGYEVYLMPHFVKIITRFKPLIQIEISSEDHRKTIMALFAPMGYKPYRLHNGAMEMLTEKEALAYNGGDFYFKTA